MHLKSLTVRGFKSFASATSFEFEPGVTAVVGPNGSGKSNVVDALAWVMGEQGAKTLRGGKMEDVIFAGTSGRPPLGRAQVTLTIDNSDGALPIEYSEVTISRTLFRAGGSEYAINGDQCRLLDIQELLSDSGLGREMHVIIGQGQLDRVLHATAEDRRGFIEEAAGILKHRRRKEKTLRKLDAMQANVQRLDDLTGEIRRQLTPLGKQAAVARRAQSVQFDLRDAKSRLLADDLVTLRVGQERDAHARAEREEKQARLGADAQRARHEVARLEVEAAAATPAQNAARDLVYALSSAVERFRSLGQLAEERVRLLGRHDDGAPSGHDPDDLREQADELSEELEELQEQNEDFADALDEAIAARGAAEESAAAEEQRLTTVLRAAADRREGLARLAGQVAAARSRVEAAEGERDRLRATVADARERRDQAQQEYTVLEQRLAHTDGEPVDALEAAHREAVDHVDAAKAAAQQVQKESRDAYGARSGLQARVDTLTASLHRADASEVVARRWPDTVGPRFSAHLRVEPGYEQAIAAVLGPFAEALTVSSGEAPKILDFVVAEDLGRLHVIHTIPLGAGASGEHPESVPPPEGCTWALDAVEAAEGFSAIVAQLLSSTAIAHDVATAYAAFSTANSRLRQVATTGGVVVTRTGIEGGTPQAPSLLEQQALVEAAREELQAAAAREERVSADLDAAREALRSAEESEHQARQAHREAEHRNAHASRQLALLTARLQQADAEAERAEHQAERAQEQIAAELQTLEGVAARLDAAQTAPEDDEEPSSEERDRLNAVAAAARQREVEARLALRSSEERAANLNGRIQSLRRAAETEQRARVEAERRARQRAIHAEAARAVVAAAHEAAGVADRSLARARHDLAEAEAERTRLEAELGDARKVASHLDEELRVLADRAHQEEMAHAEHRLRIEAVENKAVEELGLTPEHLVEHFGPDQPVPVPDDDQWAELRQEVDEHGQPLTAGKPYDRSEQRKRLKQAEKDLASLGKVNPLALEEFAALEERHKFLVEQLEDLNSSRRDLLEIIKDVDEHVETVFAEAFEDTRLQFERVFGRLFPGGEGRLVLTAPEDMLNTGIEVEARPAGKKVKRLSLLSGGERSLTAVALLVAIFKARPSPFYVMDEVEAALDDTNLGRLITIFEELRESSQLIVITHQKRTMEVADALYGVSMRGDGVTQVISQRLERVSGASSASDSEPSAAT
ncbi:chromosome segregation protein SMC [Zhihengliuella flava]|uniref:Chromosome partition protein Smc n=1 Tax=Zhihengliuella flava TaxID=1285193 RepID=A0A931GKH2_9MICC|nr:chromosome segregation protein SMC [Zhihengliuella flava]MBG6083509.1 chromosome segregation protein [Zhihengliuella flava]